MVSPAVTSTATWDGVYTRHAHNFVGESGFKDQFYNARPLLQLLREKAASASGGQQIVHRVGLGSSAVGGFGAKGKRYDLTDVDPFTAVRYDWKYALEPIIMYHQDEHQAGNAPEARMSLVEDKTKDAGERLRDLLLDKLCAVTSSGDDPNTLRQFIRTDPDAADTDLMGGLSAATYSAWRNQADEAALDFSAAGEKRMRDLTWDCSRGSSASAIDAYLLPQEFASQYYDLAAAKHDITTGATRAGTRIADVAFSGASFLGRPVIWDKAWDDVADNTDKGLALDLRGIHLVEDKAEAFSVEPFEKTLAGGVDARVGWIRWTGNLTCSERRTQGIFADLD